MMRRPSWIRWPLTVHIMEPDLHEAWEVLEQKYQQNVTTLGSSNKNLLRYHHHQEPHVNVTQGPIMNLASLFSARGHRLGRLKDKERERHAAFKEQDALCSICSKPIDYKVRKERCMTLLMVIRHVRMLIIDMYCVVVGLWRHFFGTLGSHQLPFV